MNPLNSYLTETIYTPFVGEPGAGAIVESIMDADSIDNDVLQSVEVESVLRNHHSRSGLKSHRWEGKTLCLTYEDYAYFYELQDIYKELACQSIKVWPQIVVRDTKSLGDIHLAVGTRLRIDCPCSFNNCILECGAYKGGADMGVDIVADKSGNLTMKNCTVKSYRLKLRGVNKATLQGNNFDQVKMLNLTHVGPNIKRIVLGWNFATEFKDGFSSWPSPKGKFDTSINPIKALGLDKHFKNLEQLNITLGTSGNCDYIQYVKDTHYRTGSWGVKKIVDMDNGWKMLILNDPRML